MTVHDAEKLRDYANLAAPYTVRFGGRYLARGGELTNLEGTTCDDRVVNSLTGTPLSRCSPIQYIAKLQKSVKPRQPQEC